MKNLDDIFNDDIQNTPLPQMMDADDVAKMVKAQPQNSNAEDKKYNVKWQQWVSLVACIAVFSLTAGVGGNYFSAKIEKSNDSDNDKAQLLSQDLIYPTSYQQINDLIEKRTEDNSLVEFGAVADNATSESVKSSSVSSAASAPSKSHSSTNIQQQGVDESDIVKNDGEYIYTVYNSGLEYYDSFMNTVGNKSGGDKVQSYVKIIKTDKGQMNTVSTIKLPKDSENDIRRAIEIYLDGNTLTVIASHAVEVTSGKGANAYSYTDNRETEAYIYDISNRESPTLKGSFSQSGEYNTSRMSDGILYMVTDDYSSQYKDKNKVPSVSFDDKGSSDVAVDDICIAKGSYDSIYTVVSAVSVADTSKHSTKSIMGYSDYFYMSQKNMYLISDSYDSDLLQTDILKISFDDTKLNIASKCTVDGIINDRYSVDEKDDYLRIATTQEIDKTYNMVYVLDKDLKTVGKLSNIAKDEDIESARFVGNTAYLVTYENTDPLWVIDLTDVKHPAIKGSVKISGFSSYLHPVSENAVIGVGEETDNDGITLGLKATLFDVSNPQKPKAVKSVVIKDAYSDAQYDPHAFTINEEEKYFLIPIEKDYYSYDEIDDSDNDEEYYDKSDRILARFDFSDTSIKCSKEYEYNKNASNEDYCTRGLYTGNAIYACGSEKIISFTKDGAKISTVNLSK